MSFYFESREWIDQRIHPERNCVPEVFLGGIDAFIQFACHQADYEERQTLLCPCARCNNVKQQDAKFVSRHLFLYGYKGNYYVWMNHGEKFYDVDESLEQIIRRVTREGGRILLGMLMKIITRIFQKHKRTLHHYTCRNL